jgi:pimeloyl-ACP methyl ester carboxylesterase
LHRSGSWSRVFCYLWKETAPSGLKAKDMKTPEWLKPGAYGAACGAIALAVVGFSWGGWVTGGTAQRMAADQAQTDVVAALTAICIDQSKRDPQLAERIALLKAASSWERGDLVVKHGWATMPGTTEGNRLVARACAEKVGI